MVSKSIVPSDPFTIYAHEMREKKVDERLDAARSILDDIRRLLKLKEEELRHYFLMHLIFNFSESTFNIINNAYFDFFWLFPFLFLSGCFASEKPLSWVCG